MADTFVCQLGVKTGANKIFLNPPGELEGEVIRCAVRGRDVRAFGCTSRVRLLWTHDDTGCPRRVLPPACAAYLLAHQSELRARRDYTTGPLWKLFRVRAATAKHRVIWADLARRLAATALTSPEDIQRVPLNSCYVVAAANDSAAERLAACLNSTWLRAAARLLATPAASGFCRFNARTVGVLPLPMSVTGDAALPYLAGQGRAGVDVQEQVDEIMARHLGLSSAAQHALRAVVDSAASDRR